MTDITRSFSPLVSKVLKTLNSVTDGMADVNSPLRQELVYSVMHRYNDELYKIAHRGQERHLLAMRKAGFTGYVDLYEIQDVRVELEDCTEEEMCIGGTDAEGDQVCHRFPVRIAWDDEAYEAYQQKLIEKKAEQDKRRDMAAAANEAQAARAKVESVISQIKTLSPDQVDEVCAQLKKLDGSES